MYVQADNSGWYKSPFPQSYLGYGSCPPAAGSAVTKSMGGFYIQNCHPVVLGKEGVGIRGNPKRMNPVRCLRSLPRNVPRFREGAREGETESLPGNMICIKN